MSWASIADVLNITGRTVAAPALNEASSVIEIYCNRTEAASGTIGNRDLHWLKVATAWQCVAVTARPTDDGRYATSEFTEDGVQVIWNSQSQQDLHPLAIRALKNLSWKGSRSARVPGDNVRRGLTRSWEIDYANENTDILSPWEPM